MPLKLTTLEEFMKISRSELLHTAGIDTSVPGNLASTINDSIIMRIHEIMTTNIEQLILQVFPQTATGIYSEKHALLSGLKRNQASASTGRITFNGDIGTIIDSDTILNVQELQYRTLTTKTVTQNVLNVASTTKNDNTITFDFSVFHSIASGIKVTVSGADQSEYNGEFQAIAVTENQISITYPTTPATNASGTMKITYDGVTVDVVCTSYGVATNAGSGVVSTLEIPIVSIADQGYVNVGGLQGGEELESDIALDQRTIEARSDPRVGFNIYNIRSTIRNQFPGVTNVFVKPSYPDKGQTEIYFIRRGDANIIPNQNQITNVFDYITNDEEGGIMPANTSKSDVFVKAPKPIPVTIHVTDLSPHTPEIERAINNEFVNFFNDSVFFEKQVKVRDLEVALSQVIDVTTGNPIVDFKILAPTADVFIGEGEIAIFDKVTID